MNNRDQSQNQGQNRERDSQGRFTDDDNSNSRQAGSRSNAESNPGNFANDRERAAEAGRKGGQNSHGGRSRDDSR